MDNELTRREFLAGAVGATALFLMPGCAADETKEKKSGAASTETEPKGPKKTLAYLYDDVYLKHDTGRGHPERPARLTAINQSVKNAKWFKELHPVKPKAAAVDTVALVHDKDYIKLVERECAAGRRGLSTGDATISKTSYDVALQAVGGVTAAIDAVFAGTAKNAFCAVRPPGHHASEKRGMGFCLFNNIAVAARYAQKQHKVKRVLIADWDVHHGNGTQDIFYADDTVFFMSTHQSPFYPFTGPEKETGKGKGKGFTMNRPLPRGSGDREVIGAFKDDLLPAAKKFKPELTLISCGFDSRIDDMLGGFTISDDGFRELTKIMIQIAEIAGKGRLVSLLEGGYSLKGLASAATAHMEELSKA